jgi:hypothetical protein
MPKKAKVVEGWNGTKIRSCLYRHMGGMLKFTVSRNTINKK